VSTTTALVTNGIAGDFINLIATDGFDNCTTWQFPIHYCPSWPCPVCHPPVHTTIVYPLTFQRIEGPVAFEAEYVDRDGVTRRLRSTDQREFDAALASMKKAHPPRRKP